MPESGGRGRRSWIVAAVIALVVVAGAVVFALVRGASEPSGPSDEDRIRASIDTFTAALQSGDLTTLRTATCGPLAEFYRTVSEEDFAATHAGAEQAGSIPVIDSIDAVQIAAAEPPAQSTAIAQVTVRTAGSEPTVRTFDLALDGEWRVCA